MSADRPPVLPGTPRTGPCASPAAARPPVPGAAPAGGPRPLRSYVIRAGRTTAAQRDALERLWPRYGVAGAGPLDPERLYGRRAPWVIEIGFGNGEALLALAGAHPNWDFLGIEVHPPGVGRLLAGLDAGGLGNVRVARQDALEVLGERVAPASVDGIHLWFPDPWPKKRHHKRRLVQPGFVALVARALKPGGWFHLATDWEDYARHMLEVCEREPLLANEAGPGRPLEGRRERPASRFERRGLELGHAVVDLCYRRRDGVTRPRA